MKVAQTLQTSEKRTVPSPKPVLRRLLLPMTAMLALLFGGGYFLLIEVHHSHLRNTSLITKQHAIADMEQVMGEQTRALAAMLELLLLNTEVAEALKAGDRDQLFALSQPMFEKMRTEYAVEHLYYYEADRVAFLRVCHPGEYGDQVNRFTILEAERTGAVASGLELSLHSSYSLRVEMPIYKDGQLIGYIGLAKEIEDILDSMVKTDGIERILLIRKELLDQVAWEASRSIYGRTSTWDHMPNHIVIYESSPLSDEICCIICNDTELQHLSLNDRNWQILINPLLDSAGNDLGSIIFMHNVTNLVATHNRLMILAGLGAFFLLTMLLYLVYILLRQTDKGILAQQTNLWESENRLLSFMRQVPGTTWTTNCDLRFDVFHGRTFSGRCLEPEQVPGMSLREFLGTDDENHIVLQNHHRALRGESPAFEYGDDGVTHEFRLSPLLDENHVITGVIGLSIDVTERATAEKEKEQLQKQLVQAQRLESVGMLASGIAHDFNNMLGVILGYTEMALEDNNLTQPLTENLSEVRMAAGRSADLIRQLLAFARKQTVVPMVIDLNKTVESMLNMLRRLIGEDVDLKWRPGVNLPPVKINPFQIDQILTNLCINARDAIAGVGIISIETDAVSLDEAYFIQHSKYAPGKYVLLTVCDSGCGMDINTIEHLFEPFFTTKDTNKGTGLGLATVYRAVNQNDGFINVSSKLGLGTTIRVFLPQCSTQETVREVAEKLTPVTHGSETVLLVEDEPAILRMTTIMLKSLGYTVIAAKTPSEAILSFHQYRGSIHLLVTDVVMPEMNGRDLAMNLLRIHPNIKILFISGYTSNVIAHHDVLDDGVHFLQKPFIMMDLATKLREALES